MSTTEAATPFLWRQMFSWRNLLAILLLLVGFVLIVLSFLGTTVSARRVGWTDEKAVEYQAASANLHRLSMQAASTAPEGQTRDLQNRLADAQTKYGELRSELDAARGRPALIATILRFTGVLLVAASAAGLYWLPQPTPGNRSSDMPDFIIKRRPDPNDAGVER